MKTSVIQRGSVCKGALPALANLAFHNAKGRAHLMVDAALYAAIVWTISSGNDPA